MRVRGLKQIALANIRVRRMVAPRAGAWIETTRVQKTITNMLVAPRAGAWIETVIISWQNRAAFGRTPCGCVD